MKWVKYIFGIDEKDIFAILKELKNINSKSDSNLSILKNELKIIKETLQPKPVAIDFKLVDSLNNRTELFSFSKLIDTIPSVNKVKVNNGNGIIRNLVGTIPELTSASLLANSYRFIFPQGITGQVMQIGSGQGTALLQNGSIVAHGTYIANALIAVPVAVYAVGSMIVRQHYLNKIHNSLKAIETQLDNLIKITYVEKRSQIDAIYNFYKKAFNEFDNVNTNVSYRNAILTNLIAQNIKVDELIQFYARSVHMTRNSNHPPSEFEHNMKAFIDLQELFLYGKILTFMYSNLYNRELKEDFLEEFRELSKLYNLVLKDNSDLILEQIETNEGSWNDWWLGRKNKKLYNRERADDDLNLVEAIADEVKNKFDNGESLIKDLIEQIEQPQEFVIEQGELFRLK